MNSLKDKSRTMAVLIIVLMIAVWGCDKSTDPITRTEKPVAAFLYPEPVRPGQAVIFDPSASRDPDGSIVSYRWDFGDNTTSEQLKPTKIYASTGTYNVTLEVVDNDGLSGKTSKDVKVEKNKPPVAKFTYTTPTIINRTIYFDASESYDPDGNISKVRWYFPQYQALSTDIRLSRVFTRPGYATVILTVFDNEGDSAVVTKEIYIELTGSTTDCETYGGHYKFLPYRWKPSTDATKVIMTFSTLYKYWLPGWQSISANPAIYAMAEWYWYSGANIDFRYYTELKTLYPGYDGYNAITSSYIDGKGGTLAQCQIWYRDGYALEADVIVDYNESWNTNGDPRAYDLQSVLTHELGHVWMLGDLYDSIDSWETMYGLIGLGATHARTLYCGDKRGMQLLYGAKYSISTFSAEDDDMLIPNPETVMVSSEVK